MKINKFFIDLDKEEAWLNELAKQGYVLTAKSWGYHFETVKPDHTVIRIDYRTFKKQADFDDYLALFEDSGWKHIAGTKSSGAQYFKKITESPTEDIFSDTASKAGRYKRMSEMWATLTLTFLPFITILFTTGFVDSIIFNPRELYLTPELWDMTGAGFWRAFLFETPFALFRGFAWLLLPLMIVLYGYFAWKAKKLYNKTKK